jgi:hypothetical protein
MEKEHRAKYGLLYSAAGRVNREGNGLISSISGGARKGKAPGHPGGR